MINIIDIYQTFRYILYQIFIESLKRPFPILTAVFSSICTCRVGRNLCTRWCRHSTCSDFHDRYALYQLGSWHHCAMSSVWCVVGTKDTGGNISAFTLRYWVLWWCALSTSGLSLRRSVWNAFGKHLLWITEISSSAWAARCVCGVTCWQIIFEDTGVPFPHEIYWSLGVKQKGN